MTGDDRNIATLVKRVAGAFQQDVDAVYNAFSASLGAAQRLPLLLFVWTSGAVGIRAVAASILHAYVGGEKANNIAETMAWLRDVMVDEVRALTEHTASTMPEGPARQCRQNGAAIEAALVSLFAELTPALVRLS